jgi:hypothetical protein
MAELTRPDKQYTVLGSSVKMEVIVCEATVVDGDTVQTTLQNPTAAVVMAAGDAGGTNDASAAISGKTITIHDPPATDLVVLVFGDDVKKAT